LRIAAGTQASKAAGAIVRNLQEGHSVSLLAMGAGAVNQAVKAICIARGMAAPHGRNLSTTPGFEDEHVGEERKTAIRFFIVVS
jgi:stage V sporulation protein S